MTGIYENRRHDRSNGTMRRRLSTLRSTGFRSTRRLRCSADWRWHRYMPDVEHSEDEDRFLLIRALHGERKLLTVVHVDRKEVLRIISAQAQRRHERGETMSNQDLEDDDEMLAGDTTSRRGSGSQSLRAAIFRELNLVSLDAGCEGGVSGFGVGECGAADVDQGSGGGGAGEDEEGQLEAFGPTWWLGTEADVADVMNGRFAGKIDGDFVVFLIGMRINNLWAVHKWLPVSRAMPRMLAELKRQPELGLLEASYFLSPPVAMTVQYWRSFEHLHAYAHSKDKEHLPAWAEFNRLVGATGVVGVFHETYWCRRGSMRRCM